MILVNLQPLICQKNNKLGLETNSELDISDNELTNKIHDKHIMRKFLNSTVFWKLKYITVVKKYNGEEKNDEYWTKSVNRKRTFYSDTIIFCRVTGKII